MRYFLTLVLIASVARVALFGAIARADEEELVPGDEVNVFIPGLSPPYQTLQIDDQGEIDLGVNGRVKIAGGPLERGEELLKLHLRNYLRSIAGVSLTLSRAQISILVTGLVAEPGIVAVPSSVGIWRIIEMAGGIISGADLSRVIIIRGEQEIQVDLRAHLTRDSTDPLPPLKAGDTLFIPADPSLSISEGGATAFLGNTALQRKVFVIGAVRTPGLYDRSDSLDVITAVALADGPTEAADLSHTRVYTPDSSEVVDLNKVLKGDQSALKKLPKNIGIIIYLPTLERGIDTRLGSFINVLGGVNEPGRIPVSGPVRLIDAIGLAGGPAERAKLRHVRVIRDEPGFTLVSDYNLKRYFKKGGIAGRAIVYPGSTVVIGRRDLEVLRTTVSLISTAALVSTAAALWLQIAGVIEP
ncbi:MAG: SLBB domain-containing protein [Myxococcota bacterium]|nr:SLBB domain-containing protein [Myxococcota bacterium]